MRLLRARRLDLARSLPGWGKTIASLRALGLVDENCSPVATVARRPTRRRETKRKKKGRATVATGEH